jgi:hypothetical protein
VRRLNAGWYPRFSLSPCIGRGMVGWIVAGEETVLVASTGVLAGNFVYFVGLCHAADYGTDNVATSDCSRGQREREDTVRR